MMTTMHESPTADRETGKPTPTTTTATTATITPTALRSDYLCRIIYIIMDCDIVRAALHHTVIHTRHVDNLFSIRLCNYITH
jgi:hypothetical protein